MHAKRFIWCPGRDLDVPGAEIDRPDLAIYFGSREALADGAAYEAMRQRFPGAILFGCSTGGQIDQNDVRDDAVVGAIVKMDRSALRTAQTELAPGKSTRRCGRELAQRLDAPDLAGVLVLSDGLKVNGSELAAAMVDVLGVRVPICGGLAGDGAAFQETMVGLDQPPRPGVIAAVGFYGDAMRVGYGSAGGWDAFGPSRVITRSTHNILHELDGQPALDLYTSYLCPEDIEGLPGTALLFPLLIRNPDCVQQDLVRTVLAIDREAHTMTFAGDVPVGWSAQLMRGNYERLSAGAARAAEQAAAAAKSDGDSLALMISCIGRRLTMGQRVTDEIEAATAALPPETLGLGFYSYGELSPHPSTGRCELHNQTMTIMTLSERAA